MFGHCAIPSWAHRPTAGSAFRDNLGPIEAACAELGPFVYGSTDDVVTAGEIDGQRLAGSAPREPNPLSGIRTRNRRRPSPCKRGRIGPQVSAQAHIDQ